MAGPVEHKPATWIKGWFALSTLVVLFDASYCLTRPRSMKGGDLSWIWPMYELYTKVDYIYGWPALETFNGFTNAQSAMNLVESALNFLYLGMAAAKSPSAILVGFTSLIMTFSKTVLYWFNDYYSGPQGWGHTGHNDWKTWIFLFFIPNVIWIIVPGIIAIIFGREITTSLRLAAKQKVI